MSKIHDHEGRFETRAVHAGQHPEEATGALMTPIFQNSTYQQDRPAELKDGHDYSRTINPTRTALEANLAALESAQWGLCFSSGMSACNTLVGRLSQGDHVVAGNDLYGGTYRLFTQVFERYGMSFTFVDTTDLAQVEAAMTPATKLVMLETPSNPLLRVTDISGAARIAHAQGALLVVDNTFATPFLQQPLELGADVVLHSMTKYIGGHSDAVGGALCGNDESLREECAFLQNSVGGVPGPQDCFLFLRGTKTLHLRMERHCQNARTIAAHLEAHPAIDRVIYPGLESHPQYEIAKQQMKDFGGMVSFELRREASRRRTRSRRSTRGVHARGVPRRRRVAGRGPAVDDARVDPAGDAPCGRTGRRPRAALGRRRARRRPRGRHRPGDRGGRAGRDGDGEGLNAIRSHVRTAARPERPSLRPGRSSW